MMSDLVKMGGWGRRDVRTVSSTRSLGGSGAPESLMGDSFGGVTVVLVRLPCYGMEDCWLRVLDVGGTEVVCDEMAGWRSQFRGMGMGREI